MDTHIPTRTVALQPTDKRWMTPLVKSLINDRWAAYRQRNWELHAHLKMTVRYETQKAKKRLSKRRLWRLVKEESNQELSIGKLMKQYGSADKLIESI